MNGIEAIGEMLKTLNSANRLFLVSSRFILALYGVIYLYERLKMVIADG